MQNILGTPIKEMRIAIDVDDTLAQTNKRMVEVVNADFNIGLTLDAFTQWDWWSVTEPLKSIGEKFGPDAAKNLAWRLYAVVWWSPLKIHPMPCAIHVMDRLVRDKRFVVDIVSQRQLNSLRDVAQWLSLNGISFRGLVSIDAFGSHHKSELDYDVFVDDSPALVASMKNHPSKLLLLFDRPWNRHVVDSENVIRVHGWESVEKLLDERYRKVNGWTPY